LSKSVVCLQEEFMRTTVSNKRGCRVAVARCSFGIRRWMPIKSISDEERESSLNLSIHRPPFFKTKTPNKALGLFLLNESNPELVLLKCVYP